MFSLMLNSIKHICCLSIKNYVRQTETDAFSYKELSAKLSFVQLKFQIPSITMLNKLKIMYKIQYPKT